MGGATTVEWPRLAWRSGEGASAGARDLAEESPVAITHDGSTTAVMMATPSDLEDFGVGFSLSEGIVSAADEISELEIVEADLGWEVRMWLAPGAGRRLAERRRRVVGPSGCGLCGVESLEQAVRTPPRLVGADGVRIAAATLSGALGRLAAEQAIGRTTRAAHAAALWAPGEALLVREDVGRHNALDKVIGAAVQSGRRGQALLLTSRVSVEMVQKACVLGAPVVCAVSAPTGLAVRIAQAAGLTLVAVARADGFEVFTHPERVLTD